MPIYNSEDIITSLSEVPEQLISLVPSVTETLIKFDLGDGIVGITDYCPSVGDPLREPERVGGTKSPNIEKILQLQPVLVIANQEENSQEAIEQLDEAGIMIWLTFPKTADDVIEDLWVTARIFHLESQLAPQIEALQRSLEWTRLAVVEHQRRRYFCPIWVEKNVDWWMTFNQYTYAHDILACCGGVNVFADRERRYPLEADLGLQPKIEVTGEDTRYPHVTPAEVIEASPDIIFLPSEPYAFSKDDAQKVSELLMDTPAVIANEIHFIDGRLITWHGIHMAEAITTLPRYFQKPTNNE
jgi:ABC-type Fe3+-hydroxamate transport system substrate-binding protein